MAKNDLIGGSLWEHYSDKVSDRMNNPKFMGEITEEDAAAKGAKLIVADFGADSCGDAVRLYWMVDPKTDIIIDSKYKSFGCGTAIASSDITAELCIGKTVDEAVKITRRQIKPIIFRLRLLLEMVIPPFSFERTVCIDRPVVQK